MIEKLTFTLMFVMSVILVLHTYAFTGKKMVFLAVLSIFFLCIMGVMVWCHDQRKDSHWVSNVYYSAWIDYTWT